MDNNYIIKEFNIADKDSILHFSKKLNPNKDEVYLSNCISKMFEYNSYNCFGFFCNDELIGISSGWVTVKFYSGKQLEIDNFVIDDIHRNKGLGSIFINLIELWALKNDCISVELNTYTSNIKSHKFYFKEGYEILGFHFIKKI